MLASKIPEKLLMARGKVARLDDIMQFLKGVGKLLDLMKKIVKLAKLFYGCYCLSSLLGLAIQQLGSVK